MMISALRRKRKRGFTLMEVSVTIVVAGAMVAIALPRLTTYFKKIRSQEAAQLMRIIYAAQVDHKYDHGSFASDIADLSVELTPIKNFKNLTIANGATVTGSKGVAENYVGRLTSNDGSYFIYALADGRIVCTPDSVNGLCRKMGYAAF